MDSGSTRPGLLTRAIIRVARAGESGSSSRPERGGAPAPAREREGDSGKSQGAPRNQSARQGIRGSAQYRQHEQIRGGQIVIPAGCAAQRRWSSPRPREGLRRRCSSTVLSSLPPGGIVGVIDGPNGQDDALRMITGEGTGRGTLRSAGPSSCPYVISRATRRPQEREVWRRLRAARLVSSANGGYRAAPMSF
jgi:hypothetical protein